MSRKLCSVCNPAENAVLGATLPSMCMLSEWQRNLQDVMSALQNEYLLRNSGAGPDIEGCGVTDA